MRLTDISRSFANSVAAKTAGIDMEQKCVSVTVSPYIKRVLTQSGVYAPHHRGRPQTCITDKKEHKKLKRLKIDDNGRKS